MNEETQKEPTEFLFSYETFMEAWNKHKPDGIDYDPDIFPKRFEYDIRLVKHMMIVEFNNKEKNE